MTSVRHPGLRTNAAALRRAADALLERSSRANAPFSLAYMTEAKSDRNAATVIRALPAGAAMIFRHYEDPARRRSARRLRALAASRGVLFILAGDADLACDVAADGLHLPGWALAKTTERPPFPIVTAACHETQELERAAAIGADAALLSPVFSTQSHPGAAALGADKFKTMAASARLPVLALGGVNAGNAALIAGKNVVGLAAISAFHGG